MECYKRLNDDKLNKATEDGEKVTKKLIYSGKVRKMYEFNKLRIDMLATDKISAFDRHPNMYTYV